MPSEALNMPTSPTWIGGSPMPRNAFPANAAVRKSQGTPGFGGVTVGLKKPLPWQEAEPNPMLARFMLPGSEDWSPNTVKERSQVIVGHSPSGTSGTAFPSSGGGHRGGSGSGFSASYAPDDGKRIDAKARPAKGASAMGSVDNFYALQEQNPDGSPKYAAFSDGTVADDASAGHTVEEAADAMHKKGYGYGFEGKGTRRIPGYASGASGLDLQPGKTIITGERAPEAITKRHDGTLDIKPLSSVHGQPLDESVFIGAGASPEWAREAMNWNPDDQMAGLEALLTKDPRQRNFERARDDGELTPTNVAQAQQFAAKQGFAFDPKSGYTALPTGPIDEAAPFLAAEDANGPPAGIDARDWRKFQRTPSFAQMAFQNAAHDKRLQTSRSFDLQDREQTKRDKTAEDAANEAGIDSILHGLTTDKAVLPSYFTDLIPHAKGVKAKAALHELVLNYLGHQATQDALDKRSAAEDERRSPVDILNMPAPDGKGYVPMVKDKGGNLRAAGGFMPNHTPPAVDYVPFGDGTKAYETFGGELTGRTATRSAMPADGKGPRFTWKQDAQPTKPEKPTQLKAVPQSDGSVKWFDPFTGKEVTPKEQTKPQGPKSVSGFLSATTAT